MEMGRESQRWKFVSLCCLILLLLNATRCFSFAQTKTLCNTYERSALLQLKENFVIDRSASSNPFASPKVASWAQEGDDMSDCCSWDGVQCDKESGHVIGLDLSSSCLYGFINSNSSLFQLVHLQRLDLSDNNFNFSEIPSRLGNDLMNLTYLDLSNSLFSGQIPFEISKLYKLYTLDLSFINEKLSVDSNRLKLSKANLRSLIQNLTNIKQLHLNRVDIYSTVPDILANASSLTSLQLADCGLYGDFPVGIFHLPNLEVLSVYTNPDLTGHFPNFNSNNSFKKLYVSDTNFSGQLPTSIGNLHSLNELGISFCYFYPHLPSSLRNLTQLRQLDISSFYDVSKGQLVSDSWSWVGKLTKLYHLGLASTNLRGNFPFFVANLTQLEFLNLASTEITGQIPSWIIKFTQLTSLHLGFNNLQGTIPRSLFRLKNLEYLNLASNNLSGSVDIMDFSELKKLKTLVLSNNKLSLQIKTIFSAALPKLQSLGLGSCNLTEFPEFLNNQDKLYELDLSHNNIHGQIPKWMWNATRATLSYLDLSANFLTGFDQNPVIFPWQDLTFLHIGSNRLQGSLPIPPQSIRYYAAQDNNYGGEIPPLFCNFNYLNILDLSNNNLSGLLPECFGNSTALEILMLQNNSFQGDIPPMCSKGNSSLKMIDLSYNQLQGKLPTSMANCNQLEALNIGNNQMSDILPSWLGQLPVLRALSLRSNGFHGIIGEPATDYEFPALCIIDLSKNGFSGMLPSNYLENWNSMKFVDTTKQNYFQGSFKFEGTYKYGIRFIMSYSITTFAKGVELKFSQTPYLLKLIDLSSNRFEGEIPAGIIGNLKGLVLLNLSNNTLTGRIPSSLGNLTALESLDLSQNQLSGKIPSILVQLNFLEYFNVSHNHLWGPIPVGQQFDTFPDDSYGGNSGLCGKALAKNCEDSESAAWPPPSIFKDEETKFQIELDWYVVLPGVVGGLIVGVVAGNTFANRKHEWFVEKFSRRRQPRSTRRRRGHRT